MLNFFTTFQNLISESRLQKIVRKQNYYKNSTFLEIMTLIHSDKTLKERDLLNFLTKKELVSISLFYGLRASGKKQDLISNILENEIYSFELYTELLFTDFVASKAYKCIRYGYITRDDVIQESRNRFPHKSIEDIEYLFQKSLEVCEDIRITIEQNIDKYYNLERRNWFNGDDKRYPNKLLPFEKKLIKKYSQLSTEWIVHTLFHDFMF